MEVRGLCAEAIMSIRERVERLERRAGQGDGGGLTVAFQADGMTTVDGVTMDEAEWNAWQEAHADDDGMLFVFTRRPE